MKRFKQFLFELFNTPLNFAWVREDAYDKEAQFSIGDLNFKVYFNAQATRSVWDFEFGVTGETRERKGFAHSYDILNTGHQYEVFSTVFAVLKDFIRCESPQRIVFSASEPSRRKLYDRMLPMFSTIYPGYTAYTPMNNAGTLKLRGLYYIERQS